MYSAAICLLFFMASISFTVQNGNTTVERSAVVRKLLLHKLLYMQVFKADADTDYFDISLNRSLVCAADFFGPILEAEMAFSSSIYMIK